MKEIFVSDLESGNEITAFFMVKMIGVKLGSNKKQYLDVTLGDKTGEVSSKKWDVDDRELDGLSGSSGDIVQVRLRTEWQAYTAKDTRIRPGRVRRDRNGRLYQAALRFQ